MLLTKIFGVFLLFVAVSLAADLEGFLDPETEAEQEALPAVADLDMNEARYSPYYYRRSYYSPSYLYRRGYNTYDNAYNYRYTPKYGYYNRYSYGYDYNNPYGSYNRRYARY